MKYNEETVGRIIFFERTKFKLSQTELGKKIGVVGKQISNYEKGKLVPPIDILFKLCDVFCCELGYLLGEPDYSEGTKLETAMTQNIGLNIGALSNIRKITGTEKQCLRFGMESEAYRNILNSLLSSPQFINFIECLRDLDIAVADYEDVFRIIEEKIGGKYLDEAFETYNSSIDYEYASNASELKPEQREAINMVEEGIDKQSHLSRSIKIARYELHEAFEALIESIYPRKE